MILFTEDYPFGKGETFLENEIPFLAKNFNLTIISSSSTQDVTRTVPEGVTVLHNKKPSVPYSRIFKGFLTLLLNREGRKEIIEIFKLKKNIKSRLIQGIRAYVRSEDLYKFLKINLPSVFSEKTIFYFYWNTYKPVYFLANYGKFKNFCFISRIHGFDFYNERNSLGRQPFKYLNAHLSQLFFLSNTAQKYYRENFDENIDSYSSVARLGVPHYTEFVQPQVESDDIFRICSCSRMESIKRLDLIVKALALIDDIKIEWTHFGDGSQREYIESLAEELLASKDNIKVIFRGAVRNEEIHREYARTPYNCHILTSESEGVPVAVMEAASYGIPVIATNVGGISEMLENTENIILNENTTPAEISASIISLYNYPKNDLIELKESNKYMWLQKYSSEKNYSDFVTAVNEIAENFFGGN